MEVSLITGDCSNVGITYTMFSLYFGRDVSCLVEAKAPDFQVVKTFTAVSIIQRDRFHFHFKRLLPLLILQYIISS